MCFIYNMSRRVPQTFYFSYSQQSSLLTAYIVSFVFYPLVPDQLQTGFLLYTMQITTLVLAAGLTLAAAQNSTSTSTFTSSAPIATSSACAAQPYVLSISNPIFLG